MSGEIEIPETPNWLKELESKREQRLKARLGHEAGAGAPCLKCGDKCPGLDLHFWRKCCKICKCSKEEHEVQDDDIYGWAQFQLLGNKPNKIKSKILLPGKKDELELDWIPKGQKETVEKYLKTLPADQLPVKGSRAAQDRKQLLQKQIPIHDIDPTLCHELNEEELNKMTEYIAYAKKNSVGIGQIVNLSNIINSSLYHLNPSEVALISSRYPKGIPLSEIVKLQAQSQSQSLNYKMQKMSLGNLPDYKPSNVYASNVKDIQNPVMVSKVHDKVYPSGTIESDLDMLNPMYSNKLTNQNFIPKSIQKEQEQNYSNYEPKSIPNTSVFKETSYDPKLIQSQPVDLELIQHSNVLDPSLSANTNFDPKLVPSQFMKGLSEPRSSAFVPYNKNKPIEQYPGLESGLIKTQPEIGSIDNNYKKLESLRPGYNLPNYAPGKFNVLAETQNPTKVVPKSMKDLVFSTYDPNKVHPDEINEAEYNETLGKEGEFYRTAQDIFPNQNVETKGNKNWNSFNYEGRGVHQELPGTVPEESTMSKKEGLPPQPSKQLKPLSELHPNKLSVTEDFLQPKHVSVGAIQDINYPEIKAATHGTNDFYEDYSPDSIKEILNNVKLPDCHYCKKSFEENEFAVTIERANVLFHAECFRCAGCNQILADNVYFYSKETDNVYCGRDYAKIRGFPRCKACDELIFTKNYCLAENSTFHLKHFCCTECDTPLAGQDYTLEEGMPYCLPCYERSKANKCNSCDRLIKLDEIGCNLNGVHFHADDRCYACKICGKPLMGMKLLLRNQKLYCSHDCFGKDAAARI